MKTQLWRLFTFKMYKVRSFHNAAATDKEIYDMYDDPPLEIVYI